MYDDDDDEPKCRYTCLRCRHAWVASAGVLTQPAAPCAKCGAAEGAQYAEMLHWLPTHRPRLGVGFTHLTPQITARLLWTGIVSPAERAQHACECGGLTVDATIGDDWRRRLRVAERTGRVYCPF